LLLLSFLLFMSCHPFTSLSLFLSTPLPSTPFSSPSYSLSGTLVAGEPSRCHV
jgi:hypothetical protein